MAQVVSKIELGQEIVSALRDVNKQIEEVKDQAHAMDVAPYKLKDYHGDFMLSPLLASKAQLLHAVALINQK